MTSTRLTLGSLCLLALLSAPVCASAQSPETAPESHTPRAAYKGVDCKTLPTRTALNDCREENAETRVFYLANVSQQIDANEILVALRNIMDPSTKIYLVATQNAIVIYTYPQDFARVEPLIHALDRPHKSFRLTYTVAVVEDGKTIGTQHFSFVAADGQRTTLKEGDKVPVATGSFSTDNAASQTQFTYLDVGMNFDATVTSMAIGLNLKTKVEQSSIGPTNTIAGVAEPVVRQSVLETVTIAPLGKPLMLGSIDIPNSTRRLDIDVLIEQIK
jgi:type II secretory pathway component GspD/PulD (secretin)